MWDVGSMYVACNKRATHRQERQIAGDLRPNCLFATHQSIGKF